MSGQLCGWCVSGYVRLDWLADRAADCPRCAEHRAYKEAVAKPTDCTKNPYHLCNAGKPCTCLCHRSIDGLLPRESTVTKPEPKLILRKRKSIARRVQS
jgi:hypothetical protein